MLTRAREKTLRHLLRYNWDQRDIARRLSVSQMTVSRWTRRLGLKAAGVTGRSREKWSRALESHLRANGMRKLSNFQTVGRLLKAERQLRARVDLC